MRHCVLRRLTPPFVFLSSGTSFPRQRSAGLEDAGGPVGSFEPVAGKRGVIFLAPCSSASGLVTAVDSAMLVSSSRRPAAVNRLSLPWAPCVAHKKIETKGSGGWIFFVGLRRAARALSPTGAICCWVQFGTQPAASWFGLLVYRDYSESKSVIISII